MSEEQTDFLDEEVTDFWEDLKDEEKDLGTFIWLAGVVVDVDGEPTRAFVTARTKQLAIRKIYQILTSEEIKFDVSKFEHPIDAIKAYFSSEETNLRGRATFI